MKIVPIYKAIDDIQYFLYMNQKNPEYMNLLTGNWIDEISFKKSTWDENGVAFYSDDNVLVGYISSRINRPANSIRISGFTVINKSYRIQIFKYVKYLVSLMFNNKLCPKIHFSVVYETKAYYLYENMVKKGIATKVGVSKKDTINIYGEYVDMHRYEIMNQNFFLKEKE